MTTPPSKTRWLMVAVMAVGLAIATRYATLAVLGSPVTKPPELPVLVIAAKQLDFGGVWEQEQFVWPVVIENTTDQPQEVTSVAGSCTCQMFTPDRFTLPPRGKQRVAVGINLKQTDAPDRKGETPFRVAIWATVEGQPKRQEWVLGGKVKQAVRVPQRLELGRVSDLAPENFGLNLTLGQVLAATNDRAGARACLLTAKQLHEHAPRPDDELRKLGE